MALNLKRDPTGKIAVKADIKHNLFPYYELLINGRVVWTYSATDTGPGVINLNRSTTEKSGPWYF